MLKPSSTYRQIPRRASRQDRKCPKRFERERCPKTPGGCPWPGWRLGNGKPSTAHQPTELIASSCTWRRQSHSNNAAGLLSMGYPGISIFWSGISNSLEELKFERSTVGISHIPDISMRNHSGNPPTLFCYGHWLRCVKPGGDPGLPTGYRVRCLAFHSWNPGLVHPWFAAMGIHRGGCHVFWNIWIAISLCITFSGTI